MSRPVWVSLIVVVLVFASALTAAFAWVRHGLSARDQPTAIEAFVARRLRSLSIPSAATRARNPVLLTADVARDGLEHFADHCALCHANDGSGHTEIGRNLYPKAPDMRLPATQNLTDGEIYYIISNGVRWTGMPAWAEEHSDAETWALVHFIRHLPKLTPDEKKRMKGLNPKGPDEAHEDPH